MLKMKTIPVFLILCTIVHCLNAELTVSEFIVSTNQALFVHDNKLAKKIVADNRSTNVAREEATQDAVVNNTLLAVAADSQALPILPIITAEVNKSDSTVKNDSNILTNNTVEPAVAAVVLASVPTVVPPPPPPPASTEIVPAPAVVAPTPATAGVVQAAAVVEPAASVEPNNSTNCDCAQLKPDVPTTTEVTVSEELILVYPEPEAEPEPEEPPTLKPDNLVDIRLAYFLANSMAGHDNRPIIFKPHYIRNRPAWSAIYQTPSYAQWGPFYRGEDTTATKQRANLFPQIQDSDQTDDKQLSRKELMRMRLNQLRVSKMMPDLHPQKPRENIIVIDPSKIPAEPSPTVQWEIPRKFFTWPTFWPFSLFISSDSDQPAPKTEAINTSQGQGQFVSTSLPAQSQIHIGNQLRINPFLEFGREWQV